MIAALYLGVSLVRVHRVAPVGCKRWIWLLDVAIVCLAGLVAGLALGQGGEFTLLGISVRVRTLYNPVLMLTVLVLIRTLMWWRPHLELPTLDPSPLKGLIVAALACAGPLAPVLYGIGERIVDGRFVSPPIFWRSSPRGVDLLSFVTPNPSHPLVKWIAGDGQAAAPAVFVEYTASLSLVAMALVVFAIWRAGYRPRKTPVVLTVAFGLLALGPFIYVAGVNTHVPGPWALLRYVPGFGLARMPTRFSIVAALGVALLLAGALAAIGERWPRRRRVVVAVATVLLLVELWPAPRQLYSAEISPLYDIIAADSRPVRVLSLPFGVRDGVSSVGNFRARSQFNQTRHAKPLIGGYLSRISPRRVDRMRRAYPTLDALIKLSDPRPIDDSVRATLDARGSVLVEQANLGYVVIDQRFIPPDRSQMVIEAFRLKEVQRDRHLALYVPEESRD
jgi:hypothetical protein